MPLRAVKVACIFLRTVLRKIQGSLWESIASNPSLNPVVEGVPRSGGTDGTGSWVWVKRGVTREES